MTFRRQTTDLIRGGGTAYVVEPASRDVVRSAVTPTVKAPVFLETLPPSHEVTIGVNAQEDIRRECRRMRLATRSGAMLESGGWLFSHPGFLSSVIAATSPGADAEHNPTSMVMGVERLRAVQTSYPHLVACGSWHLHPGDAAPSLADRKAWEFWRQAAGLPHHIGVIAVDRGNGWTDPELHAWITTADYSEPLALRMQ
jgi:hypothetical protein